MTVTGNTITVSAAEARMKLGELMNLAVYKGKRIVVKRRGKAAVEWKAVGDGVGEKETKGDNLIKYAGSWADKEGEEISKLVKKMRPKWKLMRDYGDELSD